MKTKEKPIYAIGLPGIQAAMSGVAYITMDDKNIATLHYTDGTKESGTIETGLACELKNYTAYQKGEILTEIQPPNVFTIVSAVQSNRKVLS